MHKSVLGIVLAVGAVCAIGGIPGQSASAQMTSTHCMVIGNMVNCTSIGDGSSYQQDDSSRALGEGIGTLIASIGEKNFRKRVGRLLADGDCAGASRYAYEKGRLELGSSIAQSCRPAAPPVAAAPAPAAEPVMSYADLERTLVQVAHNAKTPLEVFEKTTVMAVTAKGDRLMMTAHVDQKGAKITDAGRSMMTREICGSAGAILKAGATVEVKFFEAGAPKNAPFDTLITTRRDCAI